MVCVLVRYLCFNVLINYCVSVDSSLLLRTLINCVVAMATTLHRQEDQWPSFEIDTEPIRLHIKNNCILGHCMLKTTSPLLFHSAISVAQLPRISWECHSV